MSSGSWDSEVNSHGLSREGFTDVKERAAIFCVDLEKVISGDDDIDFSGLSLRDSPTIVINWKNLLGMGRIGTGANQVVAPESEPPKVVHVFLYSNLILSVGIDQVAILE